MQFGHKSLKLTSPKVMGILNMTPDSFSDGGHFNKQNNAINQVAAMVDNGAEFIDVGGESTRPGAKDVALQEELNRVIPIIEAIKQRFDVVISCDTSKAQVMQAAIDVGAGLINDVRALQNEGCLDVLANCDLPVCLMHMQGLPRTMQANPEYKNVITDIANFFKDRIDACESAGIDKQRIILDPGYGFGKTLEQNYQVLAQQQQLLSFDLPVLAGLSRKSMIGNLLNRDVDARLAGSLAGAMLAAINGAKIIRVHDVKDTVDALKVLQATQQFNQQ